MVTCELCKTSIPETFLGKIKGTLLQEKGRKKFHAVCFACQKQMKQSLREQLHL